jgi:hypothetical protein
LVSCAFWSATISMCTFVMAPVEPPYQLATGAKSIDCLGVRAVILNAPVPIAVEGLLAQLDSVALPAASTTFLSTTQAVQSATSVYQYCAGAVTVAENVLSSIFLRPDISVALPLDTSS